MPINEMLKYFFNEEEIRELQQALEMLVVRNHNKCTVEELLEIVNEILKNS